MQAHHWAFIYEAAESDPVKDRFVLERGGCRSVLVPVPDYADVVQVAVQLVQEGAQFIELCGGFDDAWVRKVIEATRGAVAVGAVKFDPASAAKLARVLADDHG